MTNTESQGLITPYEHQLRDIDAIRDAFKAHQSVLFQLPTGGGKTCVSSYIAKSAVDKGKRIIFTVHRDNLIWQTANTFKDFGIPYGLIASGYAYNRRLPVHIASIDTLKRRLDVIEVPDLLMMDEAHLSMSDGWRKVAEHYKSLGVKILGNSATPIRLDGRSLGNLFDTMVEGVSVRWLMDNGYLSDYRAFAPPSVDLTGVGVRMGDFAKEQLSEAMDKPKIMGDVVAHYRKLSMGKRAVCFCVSIKHSQHTAEAFCQAGIPSAHMDGSTPSAERKRILNDFADGRISVLCNVELVTTGFDLSAQVGRDVPVEAVILLRPTMSLALYLQMVGRALRRKPYPAIILDHAGNVQRHGLPDDEREWSLEEQPKKRKKTKDDAPPPPITCDNCFGQIKRPAPPQCPHCGYNLRSEARIYEVEEGELKEVDAEALRAARKREQSACKTVEDLIELGRSRGYKNPTAWANKFHQIRSGYRGR